MNNSEIRITRKDRRASLLTNRLRLTLKITQQTEIMTENLQFQFLISAAMEELSFKNKK